MGSSNPGCLKFLNYTDLKVDGSTQKPKCPQDGTARWERKRRYFSWNIKRVPPIPKTGGKTTRKDIRVIPRQEAKPPGKTSELSQDRRQNHQERHQSYPKTGGKTTRKDSRVILRQEAKPPGKIPELSQDRRQNHQERHQSYPKTGSKTTRKDIRVIPRQEAKPPGKTSELPQDRRQNHQERHQSYPKTGGKTTRKDIRERRRKGKRIRSEKRQGHSRFPAGQKHMATVGKTTDRMPPRKLQQI